MEENRQFNQTDGTSSELPAASSPDLEESTAGQILETEVLGPQDQILSEQVVESEGQPASPQPTVPASMPQIPPLPEEKPKVIVRSVSAKKTASAKKKSTGKKKSSTKKKGMLSGSKKSKSSKSGSAKKSSTQAKSGSTSNKSASTNNANKKKSPLEDYRIGYGLALVALAAAGGLGFWAYSLNSDKESLNTQLLASQNTISDLESTSQLYQEENEALNSQVEDLNAQVSDLQSEISSLNEELEALKDGANELLTSIEQAFQAENWQRVIDLYDEMVQDYPGSDQLEQARTYYTQAQEKLTTGNNDNNDDTTSSNSQSLLNIDSSDLTHA